MSAAPEFNHLRACVRPVVFETGVRDAPFSVKGTAIVAGYRKALYILTARHVVLDLPKERCAIIMSEAGERLRLLARWQINTGEDGDSSDLVVFRADLMGISKKTRRSNHLLHLTPPSVAQWFPKRDSAMFFLFGYPAVANDADYERSKVNMNQFMLYGSYIGPSASSGCFQMSVKNLLALPTFDGMSGSPVFSLNTPIGGSGQPTFCGMVLRGTPNSERVHFLGSDTILGALDAAEAA
jgi:hypothetical protein